MGARATRADYMDRLLEAGLDVYFILTGTRMPMDYAQLSSLECEVIQSLRLLRSDCSYSTDI